MFFSIREISSPSYGSIQYRREEITGFKCRISPGRILRGIDNEKPPVFPPGDCPFCPGRVFDETPVFEDGARIIVGESVTFPNLYPFAARHSVTVITREHNVSIFSVKQLADAFEGLLSSLKGGGDYPALNWNFLPSAGASIVHPHLQGIADKYPSACPERYIAGGRRYFLKNGRNYWGAVREHEMSSERYLFGDEIAWVASPVPLGEREIRGLLPVRTLDEFEPYLETFAEDLLRIISFYRSLGNHAFNVSVFFDRNGPDSGFRAFCSVIARINPNPLSTGDSAFMERLHLEPVILTLPEALSRYYREQHSRI